MLGASNQAEYSYFLIREAAKYLTGRDIPGWRLLSAVNH
jgi:hypothetical protein